MVKNILITTLGAILALSIYQLNDSKKKIQTKDTIIKNQQETIMKMVSDKIEDDNMKRLIEEAKK
jgi:hypothetical protein